MIIKTNRGNLPEFEIHMFKIRTKGDVLFRKIFSPGDYSISITCKDSYVGFDLSHLEWKNLLKFLKQTQGKKYLPKGHEAYDGFSLDKKKLTVRSGVAETLERARFSDTARIEKEAKAAKKSLVSSSVFARIGTIFFSFDREKFFRFREHCLNPANIIDDSGTVWRRSRSPGK